LALGAKAAGQEAENYKKGFAMVAAGIEDALKGEGVSTLVPSVGQRFDATTMRSVSSDPSRPDGTVASVSLKGYVLNGRLVRPAVVSVGSKKETEEKPEEKT
jgi:molecular chaperone GrpE